MESLVINNDLMEGDVCQELSLFPEGFTVGDILCQPHQEGYQSPNSDLVIQLEHTDYCVPISCHNDQYCHLCKKTLQNLAVKLFLDVPMPLSELSVYVLAYKFGFNISVRNGNSFSTALVCVQCHASLQEIDRLFQKLKSTISDLKKVWCTDTHIEVSPLDAWFLPQTTHVQENTTENNTIVEMQKLGRKTGTLGQITKAGHRLLMQKRKTFPKETNKKVQIECNICRFKFLSSVDFKIHVKAAHGIRTCYFHAVKKLGMREFLEEDVRRQFLNRKVASDDAGSLQNEKLVGNCVSCKLHVVSAADYLSHLHSTHNIMLDLPDLWERSNKAIKSVGASSKARTSVDTKPKSILKSSMVTNIEYAGLNLHKRDNIESNSSLLCDNVPLPRKRQRAQWVCKHCSTNFQFRAELDDHVSNCQILSHQQSIKEEQVATNSDDNNEEQADDSYHDPDITNETNDPTGTSEWYCLFCDIQFHDKQDFFNHKTEVHSRLKNLSSTSDVCVKKIQWVCKTCAVVFPSSHGLNQHLREIHDPALYNFLSKKPVSSQSITEPEAKGTSQGDNYHCYLCRVDFHSCEDLKNHYMSAHYPSRLHDRDESTYRNPDEPKRGIKIRKVPVQCNNCHKNFHRCSDLEMHNITVHAELPKHTCQKCNITFPRKNELISHEKEVHPSDQFYCKFCPKVFKNGQYLRLHLYRKDKHGDKNNFCETCSISFDDKISFHEHLESEHPMQDFPLENAVCKFGCQVCFIFFNSTAELSQHQVEENHSLESDDLPISFEDERESRTMGYKKSKKTCRYCGMVCPTINMFLQHYSETHKKKGIKAIECSYCGLKVLTLNSLESHITRVHNRPAYKRKFTKKPIKCQECLHESYTNAMMEKHMSDQHGVERPKSMCNYCGKHVAPTHLKLHIANLHENSRDFPCNYCGLKFNAWRTMRRHVSETHLGNVYRCTDCDLEFTKYNTLQRHRDSVHRNKFFKCMKCKSVSFSTHERLVKHEARLHGSGSAWIDRAAIKCHKCTQCSKVYTSADKLRYHLVRIHKVPYLQTLSRNYRRNIRESNLRDIPIPKRLLGVVNLDEEIDNATLQFVSEEISEAIQDEKQIVDDENSLYVEVHTECQVEDTGYMDESQDYATIEVTEATVEVVNLHLR